MAACLNCLLKQMFILNEISITSFCLIYSLYDLPLVMCRNYKRLQSKIKMKRNILLNKLCCFTHRHNDFLTPFFFATGNLQSSLSTGTLLSSSSTVPFALATSTLSFHYSALTHLLKTIFLCLQSSRDGGRFIQEGTR